MILKELIHDFTELAPAEYAMSWDNSGLLIGHPDADIQKVYISLDASGSAVDQAVMQGCDLLLTHHPLIFSPVKSIRADDFIGRRLLKLAENRISLYAMHTNFDITVMGRIVAEKLGQTIEGPLETILEENGQKAGIGTVGGLSGPIKLEDLAKAVKDSFELPQVRMFGDPQRLVRKAAICPGSGKGMAGEAIALGCDVLITGDIDHHEGIDSVEKGLAVLDAGHHGLEHIFVTYMAEWMQSHYPGIEVIRDVNSSPFSII